MTNRLLIEKARRIYTRRLLEAISETDVVDKEGNVLISKDLKVVHKDSGYEYTVDDVVKTGDKVSIVLRAPDEPRFEPAPSTDILDELDKQLTNFISGDVEISHDGEAPSEDTGDVFVVDEEAFEKEYEIK